MATTMESWGAAAEEREGVKRTRIDGMFVDIENRVGRIYRLSVFSIDWFY